MASAACEALCAQWFQSQRLPGLAVGLQHGEHTVWAGQWGQAQLELGVATGPETVFEIASVTKLFTTEAVLKAVQAGQLRLDDSLGQHLEGLPAAWQSVQVQQILAHQSGLRNYTAVPEYWLHTREDLPASHILNLVRWSARLHDPDWLEPALRQACWTPRPSRAGNERKDGLQLGLGWFEVQTAQGPFWGHNGGIQGFSSSLIHLPESRWTAVVLSNGDWAAEPHLLARELLNMAQ